MRTPLIVAISFVASTSFAKGAIPVAAQAVISQVNSAAKSKNFIALEKLMLDDFLWSFGGDGDAKQAIESWKKDAQAMKQLIRITKSRCESVSLGIVICPVNARTGYRARFVSTDSGWRMASFIAGD